MKWDGRAPERDSALRQTNGTYRPQGGASWWETALCGAGFLGIVAGALLLAAWR